MQHKSKINLSVILLIIGLGVLPTGFFLKSYLTDQVSAEISPFLITLEEEMVDDFENNYLGLGTSNILPAIYDNQISNLRDNFASIYGMPSTLNYLKNKTIEILPEYINGSIAVEAMINTTYETYTLNSTTSTEARSLYFNNYTYQDDYYASIEGISEYMLGGTESLNYTDSTIDYLLFGRFYNDTTYPGFMVNYQYGNELFDWLELYDLAFNDIGNNRTLIQEVYNCTWSSGQLQNLSAYITDYLFEDIVKPQYAPLELEDYAEDLFYQQWANASSMLNGFNMRYFSEYITSDLYGLEVGRNNPTNISEYSSINLWDPLNSSSFVHEDGIWKWFKAYYGNLTIKNELMADFHLNNLTIAFIYPWLFNTIRFSFVPLIYSLPDPIGIGISISEYADIIYLQQWANGTYIEEGFNLGANVEPFEIGVPIKSNISFNSAKNLLDTSNTSSFIDRDGILKWIDAYEGNTTAETELISLFGLDANQFDLITNWLFTTIRYNVTPSVTTTIPIPRRTMTSYAQYEFYRQWADGTIYKNGLDIGPFLGLSSISGWEIGIPTKTNISETSANILWNEDSGYSMIHFKGVSLWLYSEVNSTTYNILKTQFQLNDIQMARIKDWLINIRENYVIPVLQIRANLPVDQYTFANNIFFGLTIAGIILVLLGITGTILLSILKRK